MIIQDETVSFKDNTASPLDNS